MDEIIYALMYKKYSLIAVKIQILSQLLLTLFICILSLITFDEVFLIFSCLSSLWSCH